MCPEDASKVKILELSAFMREKAEAMVQSSSSQPLSGPASATGSEGEEEHHSSSAPLRPRPDGQERIL